MKIALAKSHIAQVIHDAGQQVVILAGVGQGQTEGELLLGTIEIARELGVTRRVVYHVRTRIKTRIKKYLGVNTNEQIIPAALENGLLTE
jgi:DNA-binding CsgD family transcriptional regulator